MERKQKEQEIIAAVKSGIKKPLIDPSGGGGNINKFMRGTKVSNKKIDELYDRLQLINTGQKEDIEIKTEGETDKESKRSALKEKLVKQEAQIKALSQRLSALETQDKRKRNIKKVMGITITQKTDIIRGKGYVRWYGIYKDDSKRRWIYIGTNLANAEKKIKSWLVKNGKEQV